MKTETVAVILDTLGSEYSKKWSKAEKAQKIKTWSTILLDITDEQGEAGLMKALTDPGEFMPPVGKFREMCLSASGCKSLEEEALEAWALVENNMNATISPVFSDPAIAETIRKMGGWKQLCWTEIQNLPFRRKDFLEMYPVFRRREEDYFPALRGQYHATTPDIRFLGFKSEEEKQAVIKKLKAAKESEMKVLDMMAKTNKN